MAETTGANERVVSFTARLAELGIGGKAMIGALLGTAALAKAFEILTEGEVRAQEGFDGYVAALNKATALATVGAQIDALTEKLDRLHASSASQAVRGFLSGRLLGQLLGIASPEELEQELTRAQGLYKGLLDHPANDAATKATEALEAANKSGYDYIQQLTQQGYAINHTALEQKIFAVQLSDMPAAYKTAAIEMLRFNDQLERQKALQAALGTRVPTNSGGSFLNGATTNLGDSNLLNLGRQTGTFSAENQFNHVVDLGHDFEDTSKKIAVDWESVARGFTGSLQGLGAINDETALLLGNLSSVADEAQKLAGFLAGGGALGSAAGVAGIFGIAGAALGALSSLFGGHQETEAQRLAREATEKNTAVLQDLTALEKLHLDATGTEIAAMRRLDEQALRSGGTIGSGLTDAQRQQLANFGRTLGLDPNSNTFYRDLQTRINQVDLGSFNATLGDQLRNQGTTFQLQGITDPIQQVLQQLTLLKPYSGPLGDPRNLVPSGNKLLFDALNGLNLGSAGGRASGESNLLAIWQRLLSGGITSNDLGGLSRDEFANEIQKLTSQLQQADSALAGVVDGLKQFRQSLLLDQNLTTLSPVQQLAEARQQYLDDLAKAQAGDQSAAALLPQLAQQFLALDRQVNASGPQYAADFARVLADTQALEKLFGAPVDVANQQLALMKPIEQHTAKMADGIELTNRLLTGGQQQIADAIADMKDELAASLLDMQRQLKAARYN